VPSFNATKETIMARRIATAEEIRDEIQRRIAEGRELDGDCIGCAAPTPIPLKEPDKDGCNWTVTAYPGMIRGCLGIVSNITEQVKREFNLG
jgi:hypothetical protein